MSGKQKIGNYTVLQTLGVGSFGKVKLAVHSQTGHKVALKIIGRSKLAHSDMIGRVNREIQYLKMLRHPHIIKLYEVITTPTDIIMVIEYAGGELFNYIVERGRMAEKDARRFFQQIVSAVEYCHRRNIVHRDLKPENVLLDPYNNVKVADFGLSNIMKDGEFLQTSCGSPNYAAPEVINGKLYAGPEVDAWSCGVILYVMLCGRLPFDDDHIPALFKKITSGIFTMPGFLSPGAKQVLSGLLQVDPLKRMSLSQVRQQPWFITDLPEYLKPLPESTDIESLARLDESILGELEKQLEMTRTSLVKQLRQRGTNPAKVAYQLTLDNRHMLEQSRHSNTQGIRNFALASSPPAAFNAAIDLRDSTGTASSSPLANNPNDDDDGTPSSIAILGSSLPRSAGHTLESQIDETPPARKPTVMRKRAKLTRTRWHFGIRSRSPPADVMAEVYRALLQLGMKWKHFNPYHLRAMYVDAQGRQVKIDLQLYKLDSRDNYLVDFK
ncbi:Pkinase-domain-containing protein, partial [Linderina pennispora]